MILLFFCLKNFGQDQEMVFTHFTHHDHLASNQVNKILKDGKGYTWFATGNGLQRFDGKNWISFQENKNDSTALPDNNVRFLMEDKDQRLWVGTSAGICIFDRLTSRFRNIPIEFPIQTNTYPLMSLVALEDGKIYCTLKPGGLFILDETKMRFVGFSKLMPPIPFPVEQVVYDKVSDQYWLGSDSGLIMFDAKTKVYHYNSNNPTKMRAFTHQWAQGRAIALHLNDKRQLWVSFYNIHLCYDLNTGKYIFQEAFRITNIRGFYTDKNGNTWSYGSELGLCDLNKGTFTPIKKIPASLYGISFDVSTGLTEDNENNMWLSTDNGAFIFNPEYQHFHSSRIKRYKDSSTIDQPEVTGFVELNDGRLIVLGWGKDGIYFFDKERNQVPSVTNRLELLDENSNLLVWSGLQDSRGKVWIGCQAGKIISIDLLKNRAEVIHDTIFHNSTIRTVCEDSRGNLWFGTQSGAIVKWQRDERKFQLILQHSGNNAAQHVEKLFAENDYVWATCHEGGFKKINIINNNIEKAYRYSSETTTIPFGFVRDIAPVNNDRLALASNKGLVIFDKKTEKFDIINTSNGLLHNEVISLLTDNHSDIIWLTNRRGISRVDLQKNKVTNFGLIEGIKDDVFSPGASIRLRNNSLIFGSASGLVEFDPSKLELRKRPPDVSITGIKIFDKVLCVDSIEQLSKELLLDYDQNFITIDFSSMSFLLRGSTDYYYMMEGLDKDWIKADISQQATYTYLPGGDYQFKVRAVTREGISTASITTLPIRIIPPFWQQWWFYLLAALLIIVIIWVIFYIRLKRKEATEKVRSRIARDLHDDMGSTLSTINILSAMTHQKIETDNEKAKELVAQISENSNRLMDSMDDIVWSIDPSNDSMENIVTRMREFAGNMFEAKNIDYRFDIEAKVSYIKFDINRRHDFFMIFKEAVNNLAKYSQCSRAEIKLDLDAGRLELLVRDNGIGFDKTLPSDGNGMENIKRRTAALKGKMHIETTPGHGTAIYLSIPV